MQRALLILGSLAAGIVVSALRASALDFVDDLGRPIRSPLEVCFQVELATRCVSTTEAASVTPLPDYQSLRVEGPEHGPASFRRRDVDAASAPLRITRKARLRIEGLPQEPLTVSLYDLRDATFRAPVVRLPVGSAGIRIPAGEHIASLAAGQKAPDLQRLSAAPGADVRLTYHPRDGWSLLLRCRAAEGDRLIPQASVELTGTGSYAEPGAPAVSAATGADGLALLSGLRHALANASVRHPDFIQMDLYGLSASPGTFGFREVELRKGGSVQVKVTLHGQPRPGARCRILAREVRPGSRPEMREMFNGQTDAQGLCRSGRMAEGAYVLEVSPPESQSTMSRPVEVVEGLVAEEEVSLQPTRVAGLVLRGLQPAAGYQVTVHDLGYSSQGGFAPPVTQATVNEDGEYEVTLWTPGSYRFGLETPSGTTVATNRRVEVEGEEQTVDLFLGSSSFRGRVVDQDGKPVEAAQAALRWSRGVLIATTDRDGLFEIPVESDEPSGTLTAAKKGYDATEPLPVQLPQGGGEAPPVELILRKASLRQGVVLSSSGAPLPGVWVATLGADSEGNPSVHDATLTDAGGRFTIGNSGGAPSRGLVGGIGCPLALTALSAQAEETTVQCEPFPASLEISLQDAEGRPVSQASIILRRNGEVIPPEALAAHLGLLRLPFATDANGHLVLAGLAPGAYDLFLAGSSSPSTIRAGQFSGYLTAANLAPLGTTALDITLPAQRTP